MDQMTGFGGVISFEIDGDLWRTAKFVDSVCMHSLVSAIDGVRL